MKPYRVGIIGPCASGKTTLTAGLKQRGIDARPIAQEHSYVPTMWKRITNPDLLIYLSVSYPLTIERRRLDWTENEYLEQLHRLRHAREHTDLLIETDHLSPAQVLDRVLSFLDGFSDTTEE